MAIEEVKKQLEAAGWGPTEPRWRDTARLAKGCVQGVVMYWSIQGKLADRTLIQIAQDAVVVARQIEGGIKAELIAREQDMEPRGKRKK